MTENLTNEQLRGICGSNFELAHYAINLGRYYMKSGREVSLGGILKEVKRHPDPKYVEELKEVDEIETARDREHESYEG